MKPVRNIKIISKKFLARIISVVFLFTAIAFVAEASVDFNNTGSYNTVNDLVAAVSNWFLGLVAGIAILFLIIGGIFYLTAYGDENQMKEGKKIITYTIYGLVIILISYSVVTTLNNIIFS